MNTPITKRYDFVLLFDVQDGNPNGDPDAGNLPRVDAETGMGLVTDVCIKRKVRNFIQLTQAEKPGFDIFIKEKGVLNRSIASAFEALDIDLKKVPTDPSDGKKRKKAESAQGGEVDRGRAKMCATFYDVRTFGAVMSTGANAGQVRGPIQLTFARSTEPVVALEHSITRMAVATEGEAEDQGGDNRTMGRKYTIPYGLYRAHGFVSAHLANQTQFTQEDLELFWNALLNMFEHDRSAARGLMSTRGLYVFEHSDALGNAAAHKLFETITIGRTGDPAKPARAFADYAVGIKKERIPKEVTLHEKV